MEPLNPNVAEFKGQVEQDWASEDTAAAWQKHYPKMKEQLARVTQALVDAAAPQPGIHVLDLASGTGEPSLSLARRVGPAGSVTATDLSEGMLAALRANAAAEGVTNIETRWCDAHELPFPDSSFDLVTARLGVMFFGEIGRALAEVRRVLKPDGRIAFMVWGVPEPGSYFAAACMPYVQRLPVKPDADASGPLRFAAPGKLLRIVQAAGFINAREDRLSLPAPYWGSPEEFLASMMEIAAPFRKAVASLSESDRRAAEAEAQSNLRQVYDGVYIRVTAPVLIVTGASS